MSIWSKTADPMTRALRLGRELLALPEVTIRMYGDERVKRAYDHFVMPHVKYKIVQSKKWGVALAEIPESFDVYLAGKHKELLRRKRRRAASLGFRFERIYPFDHIDEILAINTSLDQRQGSRLTDNYLSVESIRAAFTEKSLVYGVKNSSGLLRAYAHTPILGEAFVFSTLLGHGDDLDDGIMYLLISEVIKEMINLKRTSGNPRWAMYDTFFGATAGLRYFKDRMGFKPYKVKWAWVPLS